VAVTRALSEDRYLSSDERTVLIVRPHIAVLANTGIRTFLAVLVALMISSLTSGSRVGDVFWLVALYYILRLGWKVLEWVNDHFVITDKRIFELSGVLTRNVASLPLGKLTDLTYRRTVPGRLLGYGTLIVETAGQDQALSRIEYLPEPDRVYRTISTLVFT
jgi:uncharacterized membrane protein YdbT with pleckstrin-like domain